jgi:hypothetical protein
VKEILKSTLHHDATNAKQALWANAAMRWKKRFILSVLLVLIGLWLSLLFSFILKKFKQIL